MIAIGKQNKKMFFFFLRQKILLVDCKFFVLFWFEGNVQKNTSGMSKWVNMFNDHLGGILSVSCDYHRCNIP